MEVYECFFYRIPMFPLLVMKVKYRIENKARMNKWNVLQTWITMRRSSRSRKVAYLFRMNKTGNNNPQVKLRETDERVTSLFGKYGLGLNVITELGICTNVDESVNQEETHTDDFLTGMKVYISYLFNVREYVAKFAYRVYFCT